MIPYGETGHVTFDSNYTLIIVAHHLMNASKEYYGPGTTDDYTGCLHFFDEKMPSKLHHVVVVGNIVVTQMQLINVLCRVVR